MILNTKNLIIRTLTKDDLYALAHLLADEDVMRFSLTGPLKNEDEAKEYLQRILDHHSKFGFGLYAIVHKELERLIGIVGLFSQSVLGEPKIELAYRLNPEFWGKGLGSEATLAVANHAFNQLNIEELISIIDPRNTRSLSFAKRVGMEFWKDTIFSEIPVRIFILNKVKVVPNPTDSENRFLEEKNRLLEAFSHKDTAFYHIGSTAIPGSFSRPIIDIIVTVPDLTEYKTEDSPLQKFGYFLIEDHGVRGKRYFRRAENISYSLFLYEEGDPEVERALRFTHYLKMHTAEMKAYSELKLKLAKEYPSGEALYNKEKERFIKKIDIQAAKEIRNTLAKKSSSPKKHLWTDLEIQGAMEANMFLQMTYFAKYTESLELIPQNGGAAIRSTIKDDTFNYVLDTKFSKNNAKNRVKEIISLYAEKQLPFSWWVAPSDTPSDLIETLQASGLEFKEEDAGMALNISDYPLADMPSDLTFEHVLEQKQLEEFSKVLQSVGVSKEMVEKIYSKIPPLLYQKGACLEMVLGKRDRYVVAGVVVFYANAAGIYYVATRPDERRKGYASSMMQHLISIAKDRGYKLIVLQASKNGKSLYERLGFREYSVFKEFAYTPKGDAS